MGIDKRNEEQPRELPDPHILLSAPITPDRQRRAVACVGCDFEDPGQELGLILRKACTRLYKCCFLFQTTHAVCVRVALVFRCRVR